MIDKKTRKRLAKMAELINYMHGTEEKVPSGTFKEYRKLQKKVKSVVGPALQAMIDSGILFVDITLDGELGDLNEYVPEGKYRSVALEVCDFFENGGIWLMTNNVVQAVPHLKSDGSPNEGCGGVAKAFHLGPDGGLTQ